MTTETSVMQPLLDWLGRDVGRRACLRRDQWSTFVELHYLATSAGDTRQLGEGEELYEAIHDALAKAPEWVTNALRRGTLCACRCNARTAKRSD